MRHRSVGIIIAATALALTGFALTVWSSGCFNPGISLYALDNRFNETNPSIYIPAGKKVKLTVVNEEETRRHNFKVPALGINGKTLMPGDRETITLPPLEPGEYEYTCSFHNKRMSGRLVVVADLKKPKVGD